MKEVAFFIDDMSCQACSSGIERALGRKEYCKNIEVHLLSKKAKMTYDENLTSLENIFAQIRKMGYKPYINNEEKSTQEKKIISRPHK